MLVWQARGWRARCVHVCKNQRRLFKRSMLRIADDVKWSGVVVRGKKGLGKFFCGDQCTVLCIWYGQFVMVWQEFYRLTNSRAVCLTNINFATAVVVNGRSKVPTFETFGAKGEPFVIINHSARARWDEGRSIKVELAEEGVEG